MLDIPETGEKNYTGQKKLPNIKKQNKTLSTQLSKLEMND